MLLWSIELSGNVRSRYPDLAILPLLAYRLDVLWSLVALLSPLGSFSIHLRLRKQSLGNEGFCV